MATDGLWDVFDNDEVVGWVDDYVKSKTKGGILPGHEGNCDGVLLACQVFCFYFSSSGRKLVVFCTGDQKCLLTVDCKGFDGKGFDH
jgi:serine/threonine protein phosphatase PrpC